MGSESGQFAAGNQHGGHPNGGRKPIAFKKQLAELLGKKLYEDANGEAMTAVDKAWGILCATMYSEDEKLKFMAAERVFEYAFGKPRQTVEVQQRGLGILETVEQAELAAIQQTAIDAVAAVGGVGALPTGGGEA